jgi:hypothetical protein
MSAASVYDVTWCGAAPDARERGYSEQRKDDTHGWFPRVIFLSIAD